MATVIFYEKTGCSGNARQRALLEAAGHAVVTRDLRQVGWTSARLLDFLGGLPVSEWFNRNAPAVKSGEIVPGQFDETAALDLLLRHPLLIRRPLLEVDDRRMAGFDVGAIDGWIGLRGVTVADDMEACRHGAEGHRCQGHQDEAEHDADCGCGGH